MPKKAKELTALEVGRLTKPGHHAVGGVAGLSLYVSNDGARSWVMRIVVGSKRRHAGLGGYPDVTHAQAKEKARQMRADVSNGVDPIEKRNAALLRLKAEQASEITFEKALSGYLETHGDSWKNAKHRAQWTSTLETYANPLIGKLLVKDIGVGHVLAVLEPIWKTLNESATRIRGRIEKVLDWSKARGYRQGDSPAAWKGLLDQLLPAPSKVRTVKHHRALPIDAMPAFIGDLRTREGGAALALEFAILCAARSGEVRGATWAEIDMDARIWTVPADRMKAGKEHRVPLSAQAMEILQTLDRKKNQTYLFTAPRGGHFSDMALTALMRRMNVDAVPHGFRSTFRDWVGERTNYPREIAEHALAHSLDNKVEAAYRRGDALEKRRQMMSDWGDFCSTADVTEVLESDSK